MVISIVNKLYFILIFCELCQMKQCPQIMSAEEIKQWTCSTLITRDIYGTDVEVWIPARPLSGGGLIQRFKVAWLVFKGECDAVQWEGQ